MDVRICSICDIEKPLSEFSPNGTREGKQQYRASCRPCWAKRALENYHLRKEGKGPGHYTIPIVDGRKRCPHCEEDKPVAEFSPRPSGGLVAWCRACVREKNRECNRSRRFKTYGITAEEYARLLQEQDGVCAVCRHPQPPRIVRGVEVEVLLAVDHDHKTGRPRGLLCVDHNRAVGALGDDPDRLRRAALYLEQLRPDALTFEAFSVDDHYEILLEKQQGACAICGGKQQQRMGKQPRFAVDHDHKSGIVRGLLCGKCNRAIGQLGDDPAVLRAAADYLERFR